MNAHTRLRRSIAAGIAGGSCGVSSEPASLSPCSVSSTPAFFRRAGMPSDGMNRRRSRRTASGTSITITLFGRFAHRLAKFLSSASTRSFSGAVQLLNTLMVSQLRCQPAAVSLRLPVHAMRPPPRSSMIPVFSWKMALFSIGLPVLSARDGDLHLEVAARDHPGEQLKRLFRVAVGRDQRHGRPGVSRLAREALLLLRWPRFRAD